MGKDVLKILLVYIKPTLNQPFLCRPLQCCSLTTQLTISCLTITHFKPYFKKIEIPFFYQTGILIWQLILPDRLPCSVSLVELQVLVFKVTSWQPLFTREHCPPYQLRILQATADEARPVVQCPFVDFFAAASSQRLETLVLLHRWVCGA